MVVHLGSCQALPRCPLPRAAPLGSYPQAWLPLPAPHPAQGQAAVLGASLPGQPAKRLGRRGASRAGNLAAGRPRAARLVGAGAAAQQRGV